MRPEIPLTNFSTIVTDYGNGKIIPRIPLIPGFNTDAHSITMIAAFLEKTDYSGIVHILPYNNMSKHKYEKIGKADQYVDRGTLEESQLDDIRGAFHESGFEVYCNS